MTIGSMVSSGLNLFSQKTSLYDINFAQYNHIKNGIYRKVVNEYFESYNKKGLREINDAATQIDERI